MSTLAEFNKNCAKFHRVIGDKRFKQENIDGARKALTLSYLQITDATPQELESAAIHMRIALQGAVARGW